MPGPESGFGQRLREARGIKTQAEVARLAQVTRAAYARYENGGRYPSVPELRRICEALAVAPEHLIFGESTPGFGREQSPVAAVAAAGDTEKDRISRSVLTGILLNTLPRSEAEAFLTLIWASASSHLSDQPQVLTAISELCTAMTESMWDDMETLIDRKLESDGDFREFVSSLSDDVSKES